MAWVPEPTFAITAGMVIFMFGRRKTVCILKTIFILENTQIDVAPFNLLQVGRISSLISGRKFLEQKNVRDKVAQDSISQKKSLEVPANLSELFLDTADEYFLAGCCHVNSRCFLMVAL